MPSARRIFSAAAEAVHLQNHQYSFAPYVCNTRKEKSTYRCREVMIFFFLQAIP